MEAVVPGPRGRLAGMVAWVSRLLSMLWQRVQDLVLSPVGASPGLWLWGCFQLAASACDWAAHLAGLLLIIHSGDVAPCLALRASQGFHEHLICFNAFLYATHML